MIANFLLECVTLNYVLPHENLVTYRFVRKLSRAKDKHEFLLILELEDDNGLSYEREVLLGTNYRNNQH